MKEILHYVVTGISLTGMLGIAVVSGQYIEKVDSLEVSREQQQSILLQQTTLAADQKHTAERLDEAREDIEELNKAIRETLRELRETD
jgi:hypothetical protein